jgi:hypothetical protein
MNKPMAFSDSISTADLTLQFRGSVWEVQRQREMLDVMKQIRPPAIVKLSGAPTPSGVRSGGGSGVQ